MTARILFYSSTRLRSSHRRIGKARCQCRAGYVAGEKQAQRALSTCCPGAKRQFDTEIIVLCVRWYITYRLSYRDLVAMMAERG
jgi:hypothetical protein